MKAKIRIPRKKIADFSRRVVSDLESALEKMDRNVNSRLLAEVLLLDLPKV